MVKGGVPLPLATRVLRLIINAIPSNRQQLSIKGDIDQMPVGGEWLHVALEADGMLLWSSDDIAGCFHVFSLPLAWRRWMILSKPIRLQQGTDHSLTGRGMRAGCVGNEHCSYALDGRRLIWLSLAVIPMGWISAVGVIQHLHRRIVTAGGLGAVGLDPRSEVVRDQPMPVTLHPSERWWWKIYVDNFDVAEIVSHEIIQHYVGTMCESQLVYRDVLKALGIPRAEDKGLCRSLVGITMGSSVDGQAGRAAPSLQKILDHLSLTAWLMSQPKVCRLWVQAAVGRWVFDFQHRRPCFSALDRVWAEIVRLDGWRPLSKQVGDEFLLCMSFVPLIYADMRAELSPTVFCTDASEYGAGACRSVGLTAVGLKEGAVEAQGYGSKASAGEADPDVAARALVLGLLRRADQRGTDVRVDLQVPFRAKAWPRSSISPLRWEWETVLSFPWSKFGAHINELELQALFSLVKWLSRSAFNIGLRFAILVDSLVVLGIIAKGRSSSLRLNRILRRINAHLLASGFFPFLGYVASKDNPADRPSRWHGERE